jgi:hypothetical protein
MSAIYIVTFEFEGGKVSHHDLKQGGYSVKDFHNWLVETQKYVEKLYQTNAAIAYCNYIEDRF